MEERSYAHSYISELRKRIIATAVFFIAALAVGMLFSKRLVLLFLNSNLPGDVNLAALSPYENISMFIYFVFFAATALTIPFAIYQAFMYIKPSLTGNEKKMAITIPFIALFLFIIGAGFGFFITKLMIVPFLSELTLSIGIANNWSINQFMKFVVYMSLAMGLVFQMPLIISLLVKFNILKLWQLRKASKHVIIGLLVFAAIITPTTDAFSMIAMAVPLVLIFEASLLIAKFMKKTSEAAENSKGIFQPPRKNSEVQK